MRLLILLMLSVTLVKAQTTESLKLEKAIPLPDVQGRIDHMSIDTKGQRLFVSALGNNGITLSKSSISNKANVHKQYQGFRSRKEFSTWRAVIVSTNPLTSTETLQLQLESIR